MKVLVTAIMMQLATTVKVVGFQAIFQVTLYGYLLNSTALSPGTVAGIVVGTIGGLVLIAGFFLIVFFLRKLTLGMGDMKKTYRI